MWIFYFSVKFAIIKDLNILDDLFSSPTYSLSFFPRSTIFIWQLAILSLSYSCFKEIQSFSVIYVWLLSIENIWCRKDLKNHRKDSVKIKQIQSKLRTIQFSKLDDENTKASNFLLEEKKTNSYCFFNLIICKFVLLLCLCLNELTHSIFL
jgi:hypothetical protein